MQSIFKALIEGTFLAQGDLARKAGVDLVGGDSNHCRHKESPFGTILRLEFWINGPKVFIEAPFAPIYNSLTAPENAISWAKFDRKCLKLVQKSACGLENFVQMGVFIAF